MIRIKKSIFSLYLKKNGFSSTAIFLFSLNNSASNSLNKPKLFSSYFVILVNNRFLRVFFRKLNIPI